MIKMLSGLMVAMMLASGCKYIARVSVDSSEVEGDGSSAVAGYPPSVSEGGRYVAFASEATNLVPGDTNGKADVFVRDVVSRTTQRVSLDSNGNQVNGDNRRPSISADGRYVAFHASSTNLVPGDTNGIWDVFVRDTMTGITSRVSVDSLGAQANGHSGRPAISADGRYVTFDSLGTNLVTNDTNATSDVFVRDTVAATTSRVSVDSNGLQGNAQSGGDSSNSACTVCNRRPQSISADGRYIAFESRASNLVAEDITVAGSGFDTAWDLFVRDTVARTTTMVSVDSDGVQLDRESRDPAISADGRYVAFNWWYSGGFVCCVGISVRDTVAETTTQLSDPFIASPAISGNGRYVTATSGVQCGRDWGVGVYDLVTGESWCADTDVYGNTPESGRSRDSTISSDGRYIAFQSNAPDLVPADTNSTWDVFLKRTVQPTISSVSPASADWGSSLVVTLDGRGFADVTNASFTGSGVTVTSVDVVSDTQIELGVTVDAVVSLTARTVTLVDRGTLGLGTGAIGQCVNCFIPTTPPGC